MEHQHKYNLTVEWTGNRGNGTRDYKSYGRDHLILVKDKTDIMGSSDVAFRGDPLKHNPEELLVASLSSCHMLWYLHLCADAGIIVTSYYDNASGIMVEGERNNKFVQVTLNPVVSITETSMISIAEDLHNKAHELCFIANSVNFPVSVKSFISAG